MASVCERDYGSAAYWEERYYGGVPALDFYLDYDALIPYLAPVLGGEPKDVLVSGCGGSEVGAELSDRHAHRVTCADACGRLIERMRSRYGAKDRLEYRELDARDLSALPDASFDVVLDKALFDVVLCGPANLSGIAEMTAEAHRVLRPGGAYVVVSHGAPATRLGYLERPALDWRVAVLPVPKPRIAKSPQRADDAYYVYVCTKAGAADAGGELY